MKRLFFHSFATLWSNALHGMVRQEDARCCSACLRMIAVSEALLRSHVVWIAEQCYAGLAYALNP